MSTYLSEKQVAFWGTVINTKVKLGIPLPKNLIPSLLTNTGIRQASKGFMVDDAAVTVAQNLWPDTAEAKEVFSIIQSLPKEIIFGGAESADVKIESIDDVAKVSTFIMPKYGDNIAKLIAFGKPVLLVGPAGTGKSTIFAEIAKRDGYNLYRVNFDGAMTPESFIGGVRVRAVKNADGNCTNET